MGKEASEVRRMTTYEAISLIAQFSLVLLAVLTLTLTIVVYLTKRNSPPCPKKVGELFLGNILFFRPLFMRHVVTLAGVSAT